MSGTHAQLDRRHHRRDLHQPPEDVREREEEQHASTRPYGTAGVSRSTTLPHSAKKLRWVSTQPLGRPVVPEV